MSLNNIGANVWLKTPNKKYNLLFSYINNGQKRKQNGGVENSSGLFESSSQFRLNRDTYLSNAESRGKDSELFFQHSYDLGISKDSLNTKDSVYVSWLVPTFRFIHKFSISNQQRNYFDDAPPDNFYANEYYTNNQISDLTKLKKYSNEFLIAWEGRIKDKELGIKAVGGIEYITGKTNWKVADTDSTNLFWKSNFNSFLVKGNAFSTPNFFIKNVQLETDFQYGINGWNANNIYWKTNANYQFLKHWNAAFGYTLSSQQPSQMFNQFHGATNNWDLDLKPLIQNSVSFGLRYKRLADVSFKTSQIKNYTYLNAAQVPEQIEKNVLLQEIKLASHVKFLKYWNWRGKAIFQLENRIEIAIPKLWLNTELYFEGKVFKSALEMQAGLMVTYLSGFNTNTFSPSTGLFYNKTELLNQYPLADIFFNFKIKRASIFVRSSHLFQNLPGMPGMLLTPITQCPIELSSLVFLGAFMINQFLLSLTKNYYND